MGGDGGGERRRSRRPSAFSSSLPLSLSETSVPSERPVATPTSCAATRLVGGGFLKVICSARVRVHVREGAPSKPPLLVRARAAAHIPSESRKVPSTAALPRAHECSSRIPHGPSSAAGMAREGQETRRRAGTVRMVRANGWPTKLVTCVTCSLCGGQTTVAMFEPNAVPRPDCGAGRGSLLCRVRAARCRAGESRVLCGRARESFLPDFAALRPPPSVSPFGRGFPPDGLGGSLQRLGGALCINQNFTKLSLPSGFESIMGRGHDLDYASGLRSYRVDTAEGLHSCRASRRPRRLSSNARSARS